MLNYKGQVKFFTFFKGNRNDIFFGPGKYQGKKWKVKAYLMELRSVWNVVYNGELWLAHVLTHKDTTQPYLSKRNANFIDRHMILLVL